MDATSLRVAQTRPGVPTPTCRPSRCATRPPSWSSTSSRPPEELAERVAAAPRVFAGLPLAPPAALTRRPAATRAALWHIRKGLYAAVAGARPSGTTALLEDVAVPVAGAAGDTCDELHRLFDRHGYSDSVIFGHAKDGNIHFMLNEQLRRPADLVERYRGLHRGHGRPRAGQRRHR